MEEGRLRRKKGSDDMISGKINVDIRLEDEVMEDGYITTVSFIGDSLSDGMIATVKIEDVVIGKTMHSGAINITRPHFNAIVTQLGKMKSMLNTMKGENK